MIGTLGKMVFSVSENQVNNFKDLKRDVSVKYAIHEIINSKPIVEFTGVELETLSLAIELNAHLGINVSKSIKDWIEICKKAKVLRFILGGEVIGSKWVVQSVSTAYNVITSNGKIISASLDIKLQEYN